MTDHQILDENLDRELFPPITRRWLWYFKHAGMILGLMFLGLIIYLIMPYMPNFIANILEMLLRLIVILGILGVTLYTCIYGFKWPLGGALAGGIIAFFVCFIVTMIYLPGFQEAYGPAIINGFNLPPKMGKDILDFMLVGIAYSLIIAPMTEVLVLVANILLKIQAWIEKKMQPKENNWDD